MVLRDQTDMGGTAETFLTTHWSLIEGIQKQRDPERAMIGLLLERYWKPVYCYLRRTGCDNEQAKDLTQSFFHEVVLGRRLVQKADPSKGRFRAFLLHALKQYVIDTRRRRSNQTQIPPDKLVSLETAPLPTLPHTVSQGSPEDCFLYAWKSAILDQTLAEVKEDCLASGQETHWQVFRDRLLRPILDGGEHPPFKELCRRHGLASEKAASNMVITVKRRFRRMLRKHLRSTVASDAEADEELQDILQTWHFDAQQDR
ncbi:MAG: RNA polymerase sigma factor [Planctomycetota bacterium]|jgi:RNA polymerase sigma-70 factor (ECF subfamily)